ncbi:MAG TPA: hypothetical protein VKB43_00260 [Gaiellaceae bacterium]|nr:hypothetical protein [Gaiellaceae bacterium]
MSRRFLQGVRVALVIGAIAAIAGAASPTGQAKGISYHSLNKIQKRLISGSLAMSLVGAPTSKAAETAACGNGANGGDEPDEAPSCPPDSYSPAPGPGGGPGSTSGYSPSGNDGCAVSRGNNVKVNQECLTVSDPDLQGRGQAQNEESIAANPNNSKDVVASQNDYRRGDGNCEAAYSLDGGKNWNDSTVPSGFTRGDVQPRQYWQAGGDTSVGWDTRGNAYISCQLFDRGDGVSQNPDQSSAFVVMRSTQNDGASWNFPGRYTTVFFDPGGAGTVLEDKALMAIDDNPSSPFRDRIYVTWTEFAADGSAYIYETHSDNYGETFSPRVLVSGSNSLCVNTFGAGTPNGPCNENQDSDPFVGPDGALYVAFNNFNNGTTGNDNRNQVLLAKSTDGGATFSAPVLVSNYYDLPDCDTYQGAGADPFRACVPEKGTSTVSVFRATNYPSGGVNPKNKNQVAVTFGSYINKHSNESNGCTPAGFASDGDNAFTGVKTPGACNNDILLSVSSNGGASFSGATTDPRQETTVNQAPGQATTDQWWQWASFTKNGNLAVDYYDRQYGHDETTGASDFSLSGSKDLVKFASKRVTSSSMPPPTQFGGPHGGQFYGDYIWLATAGNDALPIWSDTRDPDLFTCPGSGPPSLCTGTENTGLTANDENTYMTRMPVPTK